MRTRQLLVVASPCFLLSTTWTQTGAKPSAGQSLSVAASSASADSLLNGGPAAWSQIAVAATPG